MSEAEARFEKSLSKIPDAVRDLQRRGRMRLRPLDAETMNWIEWAWKRGYADGLEDAIEEPRSGSAEAVAHLSLLLLALHRLEQQLETDALPSMAAVTWGTMIAMRQTAFEFVEQQTEKTFEQLQAQYGPFPKA